MIMRFLLPLACLLAAASPSWAATRLRINGTKLIDPQSGKAVRLTGFNMGNHFHSNDTSVMRGILPQANVVRLVGLLWDNAQPDHCMTDEAPFILESCLKHLDWQIKQITSRGAWVILTCRSKYGAGNDYATDPQSDVFHNATLRSNMLAMWTAVANRYKTYDGIAAYEIMSEPRDKAASAEVVRDFYEAGCAAVQGADPATPCMVGPAPYYKLWNFNASIALRNTKNVIYTFDFFQPTPYVFGTGGVSSYPGTYDCSALYENWYPQCCPNGGDGKAQIRFDKDWIAAQFTKYALSLQQAVEAPVFMNQWLVQRKVTPEQGKLQFVADVANLTKQMGIGWAWWVWRGDTPKPGSSAFIYYASNGSVIVEKELVATVKDLMG